MDRIIELIFGITLALTGSWMVLEGWDAYTNNTIIPATYSKSGWMWGPQSIAIGVAMVGVGSWALIHWRSTRKNLNSENSNKTSNQAL